MFTFPPHRQDYPFYFRRLLFCLLFPYVAFHFCCFLQLRPWSGIFTSMLFFGLCALHIQVMVGCHSVWKYNTRTYAFGVHITPKSVLKFPDKFVRSTYYTSTRYTSKYILKLGVHCRLCGGFDAVLFGSSLAAVFVVLVGVAAEVSRAVYTGSGDVFFSLLSCSEKSKQKLLAFVSLFAILFFVVWRSALLVYSSIIVIVLVL